MPTERTDKLELNRRQMLQLASAGVAGACASGWFDVLASATAEQPRRPKACILLFMNGGPAQSHTFDLKEGSEYRAIDTAVPGIKISEYLPKVAEGMRDLAIVRSMSTGEASHPRGRYLMHTGWRKGQGGVVYPSLGSIVSSELGQRGFELPNYIAVFGHDCLGPGYFGPRHAPLVINDPRLGLENLRPFVALPEVDERASLLDELDNAFLGRYQADPIVAHQRGYQTAVRLMHSEKARAFDLNTEPTAVRAAYGETPFGRGCLLARRLVEIGVPFVEVSLGGWDTHSGAAVPVRRLSAALDPAMATLLKELKERGLLDSTLVVWMGEFGRTPGKGDNHYGRAWSTALAGCGVRGGQVIGSTDASGAEVAEQPINAKSFMATICQALGINYSKEITGRNGRPLRLVDEGATPIRGLFA
jgi:uncharacterized protein (DUF1501 family)